MIRRIYEAPCGDLEIVVKYGRVCRCHWVDESADLSACDCQGIENMHSAYEDDSNNEMHKEDYRVMDMAISQLEEYFRGERKAFQLPLLMAGTEFRTRVWNELAAIPYGETRSYSEIADKFGSPGGQRAVAQACSHNHLAVIVPCHRVVAANGSLGGYTIADGSKERGKRPVGLAIKSYLLSHEQI